MDDEYHQVTSDLDPREILRYLNHLGIQNISGEVLKFFITDLKKLIKYDLERKASVNQIREFNPGPERLHSASTFSSRIRSKSHNISDYKCTRECHSNRKPLNIRIVQSAPNLPRNIEEKPIKRACSCVRLERKPVSKDLIKDKMVAPSSSNNLIKVAKPPAMKKCDPVSLYHYYTSLWEKYKPNVPGENNWADLRWSVRQKMAGNVYKDTARSKASDFQMQEKENKVPRMKL